MRSLFLRIFLWFWLAMVVLGVMLVLTSPFFTQSRSRVGRWEQGAESWAQERVNRAARWISESGPREMPPRGPRGRGGRGFELYIFDLDGREQGGREAPDAAVDLASRVAENGDFLIDTEVLHADCLFRLGERAKVYLYICRNLVRETLNTQVIELLKHHILLGLQSRRLSHQNHR